jgi:asparagine synthase (glutamine-hydrolysing)
MCGICGTVAFGGFANSEAARQRVEAMLTALLHRGPDAVGLHVGPYSVFGATRLGIRGLDDGTQPITDPQSGVVTVCNGEIDNHREIRRWLAERGRPVTQATDIAVIPGLYTELGPSFPEKLIGAFAVAVWDPHARRLVLARDRAGERPLFFAAHQGEIIFATELAAIVAQRRFPVALAVDALRKYLQFGIFPSPDTPFDGIQKLSPGESVEIDSHGIRRGKYWRWAIVETPKRPPVLQDFDQVFRGAVGRQSDVDVDFGVFLSGGIDSSLVSALARSLYPARPLKAFTLRFEEPSYDEGSFAEAVARLLDMDLVTVWVTPESVRSELKTLVRLVGEPLADPAWLPAALLAKRASQDIRLALVGEGGDELFGGYPTYLGAGLAEKFSHLPGFLRSAFRRMVEALPPSEKKVTISFLLKRFVQGADLDGLARHRMWVSNLTPELLRRLGVMPVESTHDSDGAGGHLLDRLQRWDLETPLAEGLLTKADRASMSSGLELRAPFLDEAVLAFATTLPVEARVKGFETKTFLKRYALRYLPRNIVYRRKRGLSVPIGRWLRGPLREWAAEALENQRLIAVGVKPAAALDLLDEHCHRKADRARALWTLLVVSEWLNWVAEETTGLSNAPSPPL